MNYVSTDYCERNETPCIFSNIFEKMPKNLIPSDMFVGFFFCCTQPFTSLKNCATITAKVQCKNILADQQTAAAVFVGKFAVLQ
jgi:hypothetical protein